MCAYVCSCVRAYVISERLCSGSDCCSFPSQSSFYDYHGNLNMNRVGVLVGGRQEVRVA